MLRFSVSSKSAIGWSASDMLNATKINMHGLLFSTREKWPPFALQDHKYKSRLGSRPAMLSGEGDILALLFQLCFTAPSNCMWATKNMLPSVTFCTFCDKTTKDKVVDIVHPLITDVLHSVEFTIKENLYQCQWYETYQDIIFCYQCAEAQTRRTLHKK